MIVTSIEFLPEINMKVEIGKGNQIIVFGKSKNDMTDEIFEYVINGKIIFRKLPSNEEDQKKVVCFEIGRVLSADQEIYIYGRWLASVLPCLYSFDQSLTGRLKIYKDNADQKIGHSSKTVEGNPAHYPETTHCKQSSKSTDDESAPYPETTHCKQSSKSTDDESAPYPETTHRKQSSKSTDDESAPYPITTRRQQHSDHYPKTTRRQQPHKDSDSCPEKTCKTSTKVERRTDSNYNFQEKREEKEKKTVNTKRLDDFINVIKKTLELDLDYNDAMCLLSLHDDLRGYKDVKNKEKVYKETVEKNFSKETARVLLKNMNSLIQN